MSLFVYERNPPIRRRQPQFSFGFGFLTVGKKKASAARMQVDYISYSLISFNFLLVVIRT